MSRVGLELLVLLLSVEVGDTDSKDHSLIELEGDTEEESLVTDFK